MVGVRPVVVDVRLVSLPTRQVLRAGHDAEPSPNRELVIVAVETADGTVGWGECSALNRPTYTDEWAAGAYNAYRSALGASSGTARFADVAAALHGMPMARAGWEMAWLDLALRSGDGVDGSPPCALAGFLGVIRASVPAGIAVGLGSDSETDRQIEVAIGNGYRRVKLKVEPGPSIERALRLRAEHPDLDLHLDGNATFSSNHLPELCRLVDAGCQVVEQPFAVDDIASAIALIEAGATVMADEAVNSLAEAEALVRAGALSGIAIKPARLGGIGPALELLAWCGDNGLEATAGGMLECGLGRHALAAVAGLDGFTLTGDLSPAGRWLAVDPWPDLSTVSSPDSGLSVQVPATIGIAPDPDFELLDHVTVAHAHYHLAG